MIKIGFFCLFSSKNLLGFIMELIMLACIISYCLQVAAVFCLTEVSVLYLKSLHFFNEL